MRPHSPVLIVDDNGDTRDVVAQMLPSRAMRRSMPRRGTPGAYHCWELEVWCIAARPSEVSRSRASQWLFDTSGWCVAWPRDRNAEVRPDRDRAAPRCRSDL